MTVDHLIELLSEYRDEHGPDAEVRLMTQENWPFENAIAGVTSGAEMNDASDDDPSEYDGILLRDHFHAIEAIDAMNKSELGQML